MHPWCATSFGVSALRDGKPRTIERLSGHHLLQAAALNNDRSHSSTAIEGCLAPISFFLKVLKIFVNLCQRKKIAFISFLLKVSKIFVNLRQRNKIAFTSFFLKVLKIFVNLRQRKKRVQICYLLLRTVLSKLNGFLLLT